MPNLYTVPPTPTREQIEAYRKEHMMYRHADGAELEPWAIEENMVLNYLCSLALGQLPEVVPLCDGCAQAWLTERNHLKGDHDCVVCAFLGNKRTPMNSPEPKGPTNA